MQSRQGQVLLITVMLLATALTVVLTVSFKSTTETQTTKLEEDAQKALAAAEAGVEAGLKQGSITDIKTLNLDPNISEGSVTAEITGKQEFSTPLLQKDEQATYYLADYPTLTANNYNGNLTIYFGSAGTGSCSSNPRTIPAVELTLLYSTNLVKRWVLENCSTGMYISGTGLTPVSQQTATVDDVDFSYKTGDNAITTLPVISYPQPKVLIMRVLFASTKIGVRRSTTPYNPQGKAIVSEAKTSTGVVKKVQLFQSYPQIPAEFFVTTF